MLWQWPGGPLTALCVFSNPCPFCTSCFCLGVHFPNSYPVLQECWKFHIGTPRCFHPGCGHDLKTTCSYLRLWSKWWRTECRARWQTWHAACGHHGLASRNTLEPVRASSRIALSWLFKNKCPPNTLFPPPIPPSLHFLIFTLLVDKIYAGWKSQTASKNVG